MQIYSNVVIVTPWGISNTIFATAVAAAVKAHSPGSYVTFITEEKMRDLLITVCPAIDEVVDEARFYESEDKVKFLHQMQPDLLVNLTAEPITHNALSDVVGFLSKHISFLPKQNQLLEVERPQQPATGVHVVDEMLGVLQQVQMEAPKPPFPTIFPEALKETMVAPLFAQNGLTLGEPIVGLVPGVGKGHVTKAWISDGYSYLVNSIRENLGLRCVLIGGEADAEICAGIAEQVSDCVNLGGKISLTEAAAVLKALALVIGGDCGLLHTAVAASTPVVGLYGPTSPLRTGPYGQSELVIDVHRRCECSDIRACKGLLPGAGDCMRSISLSEILEKVYTVLGRNAELPLPARDSTNWFWSQQRPN